MSQTHKTLQHSPVIVQRAWIAVTVLQHETPSSHSSLRHASWQHHQAVVLGMQETLALLSAKLTGRPKGDDHRVAIAAAQRRRHAACRVLHAIEEVRTIAVATDQKQTCM